MYPRSYRSLPTHVEQGLPSPWDFKCGESHYSRRRMLVLLQYRTGTFVARGWIVLFFIEQLSLFHAYLFYPPKSHSLLKLLKTSPNYAYNNTNSIKTPQQGFGSHYFWLLKLMWQAPIRALWTPRAKVSVSVLQFLFDQPLNNYKLHQGGGNC